MKKVLGATVERLRSSNHIAGFGGRYRRIGPHHPKRDSEGIRWHHTKMRAAIEVTLFV